MKERKKEKERIAVIIIIIPSPAYRGRVRWKQQTDFQPRGLGHCKFLPPLLGGESLPQALSGLSKCKLELRWSGYYHSLNLPSFKGSTAQITLCRTRL
jgi:hypothetical protein